MDIIYVCVYFVSVTAKQVSLPLIEPEYLLYVVPYGLRTILWARALHVTEPTWVRLGPIEPMRLLLARDRVLGSCCGRDLRDRSPLGPAPGRI